MLYPGAFALVEMVLFFGVILAFLIWQLIVTRRSIQEGERGPREAREKVEGSTDRIRDKP